MKLNPFGKKTEGSQSGTVDYYDYQLLAVIILLTSFGLIMLYSTSAYGALTGKDANDMAFFGKQAIISAVSLFLVLGLSQVDYHFYARFAYLIYAVSMFMLILTRYFGTTINGARRWIYIGPISFQTAELAKLAIIITIPYTIVRTRGRIKTWAGAGFVLGMGAFASVLTYVFTENLSTAIIIAGITFIMLFIVYPDTRKFILITLIAAVIVGVILAIYLRVAANDESGAGFRVQRILSWLDRSGAGDDEGSYQVTQAMYAIGSGGLFGKGLGNSAQKLGAVPEAHNDMIFSIICEELGLFGAALIILLFVFMLYRLLVIAQNAPDLLGSLIATGIFLHISLQVVLNIAVVTRMLPTTGITLPFISYGGTSILFLMAEMMLALSISKRIQLR